MTPQSSSQTSRRRLPILIAIGVVTAMAGIGAAAMLVSVTQKKDEAKNPFYRVVELNDSTVDAAIWGKNFPLQYDDYKKTVDMVRTRFGGSEALPHAPSEADPRSVVSQSKIEEDPRLKKMWLGYAFATDFREERGHAYMLEDQLYTQRQQVVKQPGTCANCHASVYALQMKMGEGDLTRGFEKMNQIPYKELSHQLEHPVSCIDCHDPKTMQLRVTRVGFMEGIKAYKASQGIENYDVNTMATRQEMRTYVCGQCHVEYYFKGPEKRLTFPWFKGLQADQIVDYYDEVGFKDWEHKETGAPMLKAQHPEFEMWSQGIHARSGVACADCHMPFKREGALKISDHHVRSPMLNVNRACQTCHRWSEQEMKDRVEIIQARHTKSRDGAMDALMALIDDLEAAKDAGRPAEELKTAQYLQRRAQFLIDFVEAENSTGFHAPEEALRVLGEAANLARQGQLAIRDASFKPTVTPVAISSTPPAAPPAAPAAPAAAPAGTSVQGSR